MKVTLAKGTLSIPPTYFAAAHALAMPDIDWTIVTRTARIDDPSMSIPVLQVVPDRLAPTVQHVAKWAYGHAMTRMIVASHPDIIHQQQATWSLPAARASRELGVPLVTTLHGGDAYHHSNLGIHLPSIPRKAGAYWNDLNIEAAFHQSTQLLAVSRFLADKAVQSGADARKLTVHYQGVDTNWWTPTTSSIAGEQSPLATDDPILLFVGALSELKGVPDLLSAHDSLSSSYPHHLVLIGDGPLRSHVDEAATADPSIHALGRATKEEVRQWMRCATGLVLPTRTTNGRAEAAGLVLLEAQACGAPVIANRVGGTPEMVAPSWSDHLSWERDVQSLASQMTALLSMNESEREERAQRASRWVKENRSITRATEQLRDIYSQLTHP
ncbi:glycosyltransferase [Pauljensenia sp. OF14-1SRA]|uniref:glycosyltransferase n=1 Tax=Pauljensenia sp. OF14-1SRA TaxID=2998062 RepID=UPI0022E617F2|nr:glycosyltransferase [Pauljensenia sp. OF14-1SRA]